MYKVKRFTGEIKHFATLDDAVRHIGYAVLSFKGSFENMRANWAGRPYCLNDSHIVFDDLDLVVPVAVLKHTYENLPTDRSYSRWLYKRHSRPEHFRCMPVPYTSSSGNYSCYMRYPRTTQERREAAHLEADEELREYGVRPRRKGRSIPTAWDDILRQTEKNWKRQRRTRWR